MQTSLNNHNFFIFRCTAYSKASSERSFFYLNVDASLQESDLKQRSGDCLKAFAKLTLRTDGGRHFLLVVAIVMRSLSNVNAVASIDKRRKSILLVKD